MAPKRGANAAAAVPLFQDGVGQKGVFLFALERRRHTLADSDGTLACQADDQESWPGFLF